MAEPLKYRRPQPAPEDARWRTALLTPGHSDQLGDRQVSFEPGSDSCIEILRVRASFAESPAFEAALRARLEALRHVEHPSLASARSVERTTNGLFLESRVAAGRRLVDVVGPHNGWTFALAVLRDVLAGLVALSEAGGAVHGVLSSDRIVVTREGRYVVTEHVMATALEALHLSHAELHSLGLVVPAGADPVQLTHWTDLMQLGYLTLSLLIARPLNPADFPARVPAWLDEFVAHAGSPAAARKVRSWLERAMQVNGATPFMSIRSAQLALDELSEDVSVQGAESAGALLAFASEAEELDPDQPAMTAKAEVRPPPIATVEHLPPQVARTEQVKTSAPKARQAPSRIRLRTTTLIIAALSMLVLAEGTVIGGLLYWKPTSRIEVAGPRPVELTVAPALPPASWAIAQSSLVSTPAPVPAPPTPKVTPLPAGRVGGLTVTSAVELQVLKDGVAIGSTTAPLVIADGRYRLDFVNQGLGYRVSLPVTVTGGQMTTVKVPVPNGRVSINAVPWAQVTIDGADVGQTPLANLSLPIGSHDVVFAHPQFGERHQTVVVKVDGIARVTQNFR